MKPFSAGSSRRTFIERATLAALAVAFPSAFQSSARAAGKKILLGVQLYSVREQCKTDLAGTLSAVSKIGYKGVEFAGYHGRTAKELRVILDDRGLVACGTHTPFETIQPDQLDKTIEF